MDTSPSVLIAAADHLREQLAHAPDASAMEAELATLDRQILATPAKSLPHLTWKLGQLAGTLADDDGASEWSRQTAQTCYDDARRLTIK